MERIYRSKIEMKERHKDCIDKIHSELKRLYYVEEVDDSSSVWDIEHPEFKLETITIPASMSHLIRVRLSKARKTETRKRWYEIAKMIHAIALTCPLTYPKLLTSPYYEIDKDMLVEGMILIF